SKHNIYMDNNSVPKKLFYKETDSYNTKKSVFSHLDASWYPDANSERAFCKDIYSEPDCIEIFHLPKFITYHQTSQSPEESQYFDLTIFGPTDAEMRVTEVERKGIIDFLTCIGSIAALWIDLSIYKLVNDIC